ncbi:MAG: antitoxin, partial [Chloroflexota bacterium]|nr:antitoxin [Chloroflexota bacterium]
MALNLHGFYSGVERLLELIARHVDQAVPGGDAWHRELLYQMAREVPGVRPAVFGAERAAALDDLRRFRHVVRHLYAIHLDRQRM